MGVSRLETRRRWGDRLLRFAGCRLTIAEFCRREGVSIASFYLWRRRLQDAPPAGETLAGDRTTARTSARTPVRTVAPRFLPVVLSDASPGIGGFGPAALELELPNQVRLRMGHDVEARFVGELLVCVAGLGPHGLTGGAASAEAR